MLEKLSMQEEEAMRAVWKTGEANVKTILEQMEAPQPPYTTLASTIKNLERKGYLSSRLMGNMYLYQSIVTEGEYKKHFFGTLVKNHFDNSYKDLVSFFAEQKKISPKELKEIIDMIEGKSK